MNGSHVQRKLKIRNRILAIFVAFLLLTLMVPKMSFADGADDQTKDIATEEVNNTEAQAPVANDAVPVANEAVTVSGTVTDAEGNGIPKVSMSAFKNGERVCDHNIFTDASGNFTISLYETVSKGDPILIMANSNDYAFEVIAITAGDSEINIKLKDKVNTTIKAIDNQTDRFASFTFDSSVDGQTSSQNITETSFKHNFPVEGQFYMTDRAQMYFAYKNCLDQQVVIHVVANAKPMYKTFFWGYYKGDDVEHAAELPVGTPLTLTRGTAYTFLPWFQGLANLDFSSTSQGHNYFDVNYVKNGAPYVNLQQASFQNTTFEGAKCTVCDDGRVEVFFDDSSAINTYQVIGYITPVAKEGYKFANWTYNGTTLKAGDSIPATQGLNMTFVANYEVDASVAPKTGDANYLWVIALSGIALASAVAFRRFKRK